MKSSIERPRAWSTKSDFCIKAFFGGGNFMHWEFQDFPLWKVKKFCDPKAKFLQEFSKDFWPFFPLKFSTFVKEFFEIFQCFFKGIFVFFPLNFEFFQCFCKGIFGIFPFKFSIFVKEFQALDPRKNEKFTPSISACKSSRGLKKNN